MDPLICLCLCLNMFNLWNVHFISVSLLRWVLLRRTHIFKGRHVSISTGCRVFGVLRWRLAHGFRVPYPSIPIHTHSQCNIMQQKLPTLGWFPDVFRVNGGDNIHLRRSTSSDRPHGRHGGFARPRAAGSARKARRTGLGLLKSVGL